MSSTKPQTANVPAPVKQSEESTATDKKRRAIIHLIPNPITYIDLLCAREVVGNTPRPSKVKNLFFNGMRCLEKRPNKAKDFLQEAVKLANEELSAQSTKKIPRIDIERMAYALMGLGYCLLTRGALDKAEKCYKRSVTFWTKLHSQTLHLVIPIMIDFVILLILVNDAKDAGPVTMKIVSITKKTKPQDASWINAYAYSRLASVASGQKGADLRLPLKEGQKKALLSPKLIDHLYTLSVEYMKKNAKSDKEEEVNALSEVQSLREEFLSKVKASLKARTPKSSTTTTTTTTTTPSTPTEKSKTETEKSESEESAPKTKPEKTQESGSVNEEAPETKEN